MIKIYRVTDTINPGDKVAFSTDSQKMHPASQKEIDAGRVQFIAERAYSSGSDVRLEETETGWKDVGWPTPTGVVH